MMSLIVVGYGILFFGLGNEQLSPLGFFNFVCSIRIYEFLSQNLRNEGEVSMYDD